MCSSDLLQVAEGVTHIVVRRCFNMSSLLQTLTKADELPQTLARADETTKPYDYDGRSTVPVEDAFHKGRNFH